MKSPKDIAELIEKYHLGLLTEEDRIFVEEKMRNDPDFAEDVKLDGLVNSLVHTSGLDMLREQMTNDLVRIDQKRARKKWWTGTAIVGTLLVVSSLIYFTNDPEKKEVAQPGFPEEQNPVSGDKRNADTISENSNEKNDTGKPGLRQKEEKNQPDKTDTSRISIPLPLQEINDSTSKVPILPAEKIEPTDQVEKKDNNPKTDKLNTCLLSFEVIVHASCKGETTGSVFVDEKSIAGGSRPYVFKISNSGKESSSGAFYDIGGGKYTVTMEDSKKCAYSKEVKVPEKNCTTKKSYSFNPDYGETWKIPFGEGESGILTVYNKSGIVIFKDRFGSSDRTEWNGTDRQGATIETGLYSCILEFSNGKTEVVEITIVR